MQPIMSDVASASGRRRGLGRQYAPWLAGLLALFCFRVVAQLLQAFFGWAHLPPFEAWHSGIMPYWLLVLCQLVIIAALAKLLVLVRRDVLAPGRWQPIFMLAAGVIYFSFMTFRLIAGLTILADEPWFAAPLPSIFHLVLASYVLILGHYLWRVRRAPSPPQAER